MSLPWVWGATAREVADDYPCAGHLNGPRVSATRAVSVAAPVELAYDWLCQLKVAPYSYDLVDNLGRRSPPELTPGAAPIRAGDRVMVFRCVESVPGREWTGVALPWAERMYGAIAATYRVSPLDSGGSRLVCRLDLPLGPSAPTRLRAHLLAWGDVVMMRRQLLTLKRHAERDAVEREPAA